MFIAMTQPVGNEWWTVDQPTYYPSHAAEYCTVVAELFCLEHCLVDVVEVNANFVNCKVL